MMQICKTKAEMGEILNPYFSQNKSVGFVPTMGALHQGHLSLVKTSVAENELTVVSIFVNPTQFNNSNDLENYPRTFESDVQMLKKMGCQVVFSPSTNEMYPEKDSRQFDFEGIDSRMEGEHRPGHFNGVAQIVSKLFDAIPANKAYFGLKDFQQLAIIKHLVKQLNLKTIIVPCETIREQDGLAMSSRNALLLPEFRSIAPIINKTLLIAKGMVSENTVVQIKGFVNEQISKTNLELEYFDIVNDTSLHSIEEFSTNQSLVACIAVWAGKVRLIDNIQINL